ncbi:MAG: hypothetical protein GKR90_06545 [Pseudomonadales bacterium]|nr:hypothetical protein [Pseudomonadales bacterium]
MRALIAAFLLLTTSSTFAAGVDDLSFLKGRWSGALGPATLEETWNDPKAGTMVAVVRMSSPEGTVFVELIIITEEDDSLVLRLQQFSPAYEKLMDTHTMVMADISDNSVSFTSDSETSLTKLSYTRVSETEFTISGEGPQGPFTAPLQAVAE